MCSFFQQCNHHRVFYLLLWKVGWIMRENNSATEIIVPITQFKIQSHWSCVLAACRKSFIEICFSLFLSTETHRIQFYKTDVVSKKGCIQTKSGIAASGHRVLWQRGWLLGLCWFVLNVATMKQSENYVIMLINQLFRYQRSLTLIHSLCRLSNTLPLFVKQSETTQM